MIKFFRKIRQRLLSENKFSKYLIYAIGEIVLVVIGILIALQINNWNTQKKEREELKGYLSNIVKNIEFDMGNIRETIDYSENMRLVARRSQSFKNPDSITAKKLLENFSPKKNPFMEFYFQSEKSGFEALKNSGYLNKLKGKSLESKLYAYYYLVKKIEEQEKSQNEFIERMEVKGWSDNMFQEFLELFTEVAKTNTVSDSQKKQLARFYNHPTITSVYFRVGEGESILGRYYRKLLLQGENVVEEIENELGDKN